LSPKPKDVPLRILGRKRIIGLGIIGIIFLGAMFYAAVFLEFLKVPTGAMKNTILPGDRIVANKFLGEIGRGDIVLYKYPRNLTTRFIKRIIGLPGETNWYHSQNHSCRQ